MSKHHKPKPAETLAFYVVNKKDDSGIDPRIVTYHDESSPIAEEYKILRTNIKSHFMRKDRMVTKVSRQKAKASP